MEIIDDLVILCLIGFIQARKVPAENDICTRFPTLNLCHHRRQQDQPAPEGTLNQQPEEKQNQISLSTTSTPSPFDTTTEPYCPLDEKRYFENCKKNEKKREKMRAFCHHYEATCFLTTMSPPLSEILTGNSVSPVHSVPVPKPGSMLANPSLGPGYMYGYQKQMYGTPLDQGFQNNMANAVGQVPQSGGAPGAGTGAMGAGQGAGAVPPLSGNQGLLSGLNTQPLAPLANAGSATGNIPNAAAQGMGNMGSNPGLGWGTGVGAPFFNGMRGGQVNPFQGVSMGTGINAAGLPISATRGVSWGGLIPFGGMNGMMGR